MLRDADKSLDSVRFLFGTSRADMWYHEIVDMYRRIFFIGLIPLLGSDVTMKAYIGSIASIFSMIYHRETCPFKVHINKLGTFKGRIFHYPTGRREAYFQHGSWLATRF